MHKKNMLPPHLSMDEYAEFVEKTMKECDWDKSARQKKIEKQIKVPFSLNRKFTCRNALALGRLGEFGELNCR